MFGEPQASLGLLEHPSTALLPGHPKSEGEELACIEISESACSKDDTPARRAGHIAVSRDGSLFAVSELHGTRIFVYEARTMNLRQTLDATRGADHITELMFAGSSRQKLIVHSSGFVRSNPYTSQWMVRIFDLDDEYQTRSQLETATEVIFEAYSKAVEDQLPWAKEHVSRDLVSKLILDTQIQRDLARGTAFTGYGQKSISRDGTLMIIEHPNKTSIVDISLSTPQERFSIPYNYLTPEDMADDIQFYPDPLLPDRHFVAAIFAKKHELQIVDAETGETENLGHHIPRGSIIFSPDGTVVTMRQLRGPHPVWEVKSGSVLYSIPSSSSHPMMNGDISFSLNGKYLMVASKGSSGTLTIYDALSGDKLYDWRLPSAERHAHRQANTGRFQMGMGRLYPVIRHSASGLVVAPLDDGGIALYDPTTNRQGFLPSSKLRDGYHDAMNLRPGTTWESTIAPTAEVAFSPDGKIIYSADVDGKVRVWALE
ncbi:hypothetical protein VNI00_007609 [Paramarasmius palmivorus]|uniref:Uncharacterized protein n=1 Tax=Paramarasmius palmivorus TaxID=297713 RepID=A0AAW0D1V0_9AGAR